MKRKQRMNKRIKMAGAIVSLAILFIGICPVTATAEVSSLTVRAGFYGGPYYEIHTFTYDEMCRLATEEPITYSGLDTGNFVRIIYAWGVKMETLLAECNINMDSVKYFHMSTADNYGESTTTFSSDILSERFFYPNLARTMSDRGQVSTGKDEYMEGAVRVPTILAINCSDFSREEALRVRQDGNYQTVTPKDLSAEYRYRLVYGQKTLAGSLANGYNVQTSGKYIKAMDIQLEGSPALIINRTLISGKEGETGSKYLMEVETTLPDSYAYLPQATLKKLEAQIIDNIKVSGFNSNIIHVTGLDSDNTLKGNTCQVEIVGKGETQIQFSYSRKEFGGNTTVASTNSSIAGISSGEANSNDGSDNNGGKNNQNDNGNASAEDPNNPDSGTKNIITANQNPKGGSKPSAADHTQWVAFDPQSTVIDISSNGAGRILVATGIVAGVLLLSGFCSEVIFFRRSRERTPRFVGKK